MADISRGNYEHMTCYVFGVGPLDIHYCHLKVKEVESKYHHNLCLYALFPAAGLVKN